MIRAYKIRRIMNVHIPKNQWISLDNIYLLMEGHGNLDIDDSKYSAPGNMEPKWKRNVRNVLQADKKVGKIVWAKVRPEYMIPEY